MSRPKGLPRTGGKPKGYKTQGTLNKEQAREALRQIVLREMDSLVSSQVAHARGLKYLVVRDKKTGKFLRVGELQAKTINPEEEIIEIWEKEPSVQAFTDLMNRTLDKPAEHVELTGAGGQPLEVRWKD